MLHFFNDHHSPSARHLMVASGSVLKERKRLIVGLTFCFGEFYHTLVFSSVQFCLDKVQ